MMVAPALLEHVSKEVERDTGILKQVRKAREERRALAQWPLSRGSGGLQPLPTIRRRLAWAQGQLIIISVWTHRLQKSGSGTCFLYPYPRRRR